MNKKSILSNSETDWARIDATSDEDIDFSDCPEVTPEMFAKAVVRRAPKSQATLTYPDDELIEDEGLYKAMMAVKDETPLSLEEALAIL
jgi:hypothetical protein